MNLRAKGCSKATPNDTSNEPKITTQEIKYKEVFISLCFHSNICNCKL
jgi:hypothetical protein